MEDIKSSSYYQGDRPDIIEFIPDSAHRILDVGYGEGAFAISLNTSNREIGGVEIHDDAAKIATQTLYKVFSGSIEENLCLLPDAYFDLIIFNDVLEHLVNPGPIPRKLAES